MPSISLDHSSLFIRQLSLENQNDAYQLKVEYLDDGPFEEFMAMYNKYSELFVGLFNAEELIGISFGWPLAEQFPEEKDEISLQGIVVRHDFAAQGLGSKLLAFWEEQVAKRSERFIGVGSAPGYVERFYLKHGYKPIQYLLYGNDLALAESLSAKGYEIVRTRMVEDTMFVNVKTDRYAPDVRNALCKEFDADEVIYIFQKKLPL
ncbi:MAG: GNAT family N-acetyltransferase [Chloroflexota bacterium]